MCLEVEWSENQGLRSVLRVKMFPFTFSSDAMKSWRWRLNSRKAIKQIFFITAPGTWGISPPNVHAKHGIISG